MYCPDRVTGVVTAWAARKENATDRHCSHSSVMSIRNLMLHAEKFVKMRKNYVKYWIPCHRKKEKEKENKK